MLLIAESMFEFVELVAVCLFLTFIGAILFGTSKLDTQTVKYVVYTLASLVGAVAIAFWIVLTFEGTDGKREIERANGSGKGPQDYLVPTGPPPADQILLPTPEAGFSPKDIIYLGPAPNDSPSSTDGYSGPESSTRPDPLSNE